MIEFSEAPNPQTNFSEWDEWRKRVCLKIDSMSKEERSKLAESISTINNLFRIK